MLTTKAVIASYSSLFEVEDVATKACQLPKDLVYSIIITAIQQCKPNIAATINFWLSALAKSPLATDLVIAMETLIVADVGVNSANYYNFLINHNISKILAIDNVLDKGFSLIIINNYAKAKIGDNYQLDPKWHQSIKTAIEQFKIELVKTIK